MNFIFILQPRSLEKYRVLKLKENHQEENSILTGEHLLKMKSNDNATETVGFTTITSKQIV